MRSADARHHSSLLHKDHNLAHTPASHKFSIHLTKVHLPTHHCHRHQRSCWLRVEQQCDTIKPAHTPVHTPAPHTTHLRHRHQCPRWLPVVWNAVHPHAQRAAVLCCVAAAARVHCNAAVLTRLQHTRQGRAGQKWVLTGTQGKEAGRRDSRCLMSISFLSVVATELDPPGVHAQAHITQHTVLWSHFPHADPCSMPALPSCISR